MGCDIWIDSVMCQEYLWYRDMLLFVVLDYFQKLEVFLKKVVVFMDNGFSKIDFLLDEFILSYGFDYILYKVFDNDIVYNVLIFYVVFGLFVEEVGLQCGYWIMMMNGDYIIKKVELELLQGSIC